MEKVIWAKSYVNSLRRLSPAMQSRATWTMMQFMEDKYANTLRYEQLHGCREETISSIRVTDGFRIILCWIPKLESYLFLYVDQHDDAYDWAQKAVISLDSETMTLQVYHIPEAEAAPAPEEQSLFPASRYSDKSLRRLGVPEELLVLVRSIQDDNELLQEMEAETFPAEVGERLFNLADGMPLSDLLADVEANQGLAGGDPLKNPETLRSFFVLPSDPDLREAVLQNTLEQWRIFLHPSQRRLVEERFDGPVLVLGGAGTGKTITALHRAKALAARMIQEKTEGKILYTFYTVNLAWDIIDKLRSICTAEEFKRIEVLNVDKLSRLNSLPGYEQVSILYPKDQALKGLWEEAVSFGDSQRTRSVEFYRWEWEHVVAEQGAFTLDEYLRVRRVGGRKPLSSGQRREVWRVFEAYQNLMRERRMFDHKTAMHLYCQQIAGQEGPRYRHIIVDEAQDFNAGSLRLLRTLAGPERKDDLFLVGDPRQRIYDHRASLAACGIRVQGRTRRLWLNYRTTYQLQKSATQLLEGEDFDDLNGGTDQGTHYFSCTSGPLPQVKFFDSGEEELQWIYEELEQLRLSGVPSRDICLTAYSKDLTGGYIRQLNGLGVQTYELKNKADDRSMEGVRVGTMHRVKGLEFQYMLIAGINRGIFPRKSAGQPRESLKQDKCLLYVALTRAQKGAYVCGFGKAPSEFLRELSDAVETAARREAAAAQQG